MFDREFIFVYNSYFNFLFLSGLAKEILEYFPIEKYILRPSWRSYHFFSVTTVRLWKGKKNHCYYLSTVFSLVRLVASHFARK